MHSWGLELAMSSGAVDTPWYGFRLLGVRHRSNFSFGAHIVAPGTGLLLNNEMDDFAARPGFANAYGLIQGEANAIVPGRRPLSSMTPTLVFKDGKPWLATGSPGGSLIITAVLQTLLNARSSCSPFKTS